MVTINTQTLKDELSSYLRRAEGGEKILVLQNGEPIAVLVSPVDIQGTEASRLANLEARGLIQQPRAKGTGRFKGPRVKTRGKLASEMVIEDRR